MTCPKCSTEHDPKLCQGHVIKDQTTREPIPPRQCAKTPVKGATVCRSHGAGKGSPAAAAAETRQQETAAEAEVRKLLWVGLDSAPAVTDPVASLARLAGALEQAVDHVGAKVNDLGSVASGSSMQQLRGEVVLLERLLGQLRQALDAMARLGIAERHVELEQERASLVTAAFLAALQAVVLLPADRDLMLRTFLGGLGRGPDVLEVEGGAA